MPLYLNCIQVMSSWVSTSYLHPILCRQLNTNSVFVRLSRHLSTIIPSSLSSCFSIMFIFLLVLIVNTLVCKSRYSLSYDKAFFVHNPCGNCILFPDDEVTRQRDPLGFASLAPDAIVLCHSAIEQTEKCLSDYDAFLVNGVQQWIGDILDTTNGPIR